MTDDNDPETAILSGGPLDGKAMPLNRDQTTVNASATTSTVTLTSTDASVATTRDLPGSVEDFIYTRTGTLSAKARAVFNLSASNAR